MKPLVSKLLLALLAILVIAIAVIPVQKAQADELVPIPSKVQNPCAQGSELDTATGLCTNTQGTRLQSLITFVANIVFGVVGTVTVIMIIVAGIQMSTSAGNPDAIKSAKNKLVAAITSLVLLVAMAVIFNLIGFQVA